MHRAAPMLAGNPCAQTTMMLWRADKLAASCRCQPLLMPRSAVETWATVVLNVLWHAATVRPVPPDCRSDRVQELQLLTAKSDLEQRVQRLKVQAEQKGVHLETGGHPEHLFGLS